MNFIPLSPSLPLPFILPSPPPTPGKLQLSAVVPFCGLVMGRVLVHENEHTTVLDMHAPNINEEIHAMEMKPPVQSDTYLSFDDTFDMRRRRGDWLWI